MTKLNKCPCGEIPKKLNIVDACTGYKYANVTGACCRQWRIEFNREDKSISSKGCMKLAINEWNEAMRGFK